MAHRFHNDGPPDFFLSCSGSEKSPCRSRNFMLPGGTIVQLLLQTVDEGPIYIGRPGFLDSVLTQRVTYGRCQTEYGPSSVWEPI